MKNHQVLDNSSYHAQPHSIMVNYWEIYIYVFSTHRNGSNHVNLQLALFIVNHTDIDRS
jgi:hypothetical protein